MFRTTPASNGSSWDGAVRGGGRQGTGSSLSTSSGRSTTAGCSRGRGSQPLTWVPDRPSHVPKGNMPAIRPVHQKGAPPMFRDFIVVSLLMASAAPMLAQDSSTAQTRRHRVLRPSAESVLGMRARLELTERQIADLTRIRQENLRFRQEEMTARMELQSRLRAGDITRDQFAAELGKRREAVGARLGSQGTDRVSGVLTDAQREKLRTLRRQEFRQRVGQRGFRSERGQGRGFGPGRGGFGNRSFGPGRRGPGRGDDGIRGRREGDTAERPQFRFRRGGEERGPATSG